MKFYVDEFDRLAMKIEDYEMLSNEEKAVFAGQEMIV